MPRQRGVVAIMGEGVPGASMTHTRWNPQRSVPGVAASVMGNVGAVTAGANPSRDGRADAAASRSRRDREAWSDRIETRLDIPMAALAVVWTALVVRDLLVPDDPNRTLRVLSNVIWIIFVTEFVVKLVVSGHPLRFLRRRWPSIFFLALPALRIFRITRAVRVVRALPAARAVGSSYRTTRAARSLFGGRIAFLVVTSAVVILAGAQLLFLTEGEAAGREGSFADALWWTANAAISGNQVFEPETSLGRLIAVVLSGYAVVVFASVAASLGAFFIESSVERADPVSGIHGGGVRARTRVEAEDESPGPTA